MDSRLYLSFGGAPCCAPCRSSGGWRGSSRCHGRSPPGSGSTRWPAGRPSRPASCARRERLAFSTLKLALPGYLILAQVPLARFLTVPKRNSYAEWMRRLGNQCVDFVVCDVTSQVVAVVEVRPPLDQLDEQDQGSPRAGRARPEGGQDSAPRLERGKAADHRGGAREAAAERAAVPAGMGKKAAPALAAATATVVGAAEFSEAAFSDAAMIEASMGDAVVEGGPAVDPFADTDRDWSQGEVIEVREPSTTSWFDDLDSVTAELPPVEKR